MVFWYPFIAPVHVGFGLWPLPGQDQDLMDDLAWDLHADYNVIMPHGEWWYWQDVPEVFQGYVLGYCWWLKRSRGIPYDAGTYDDVVRWHTVDDVFNNTRVWPASGEDEPHPADPADDDDWINDVHL